MRIGFIGFTTDADLLVTPPTSIKYRLPAANRVINTAARSWQFHRLTQQSSLEIQMTWKDIPESELAALAYIPADEIHTLITDTGREYNVILNEPTRSPQPIYTADGQWVYSASLVAYVVNEYAMGEVSSDTPPTVRLLAITNDINAAQRNYPPAQPTAAYTPIVPAAANGLPPGVKYGEGMRWTFLTSDTSGNWLRYYSTDADGWFECAATTPLYKDWYSPVNNNRLVASVLQRAWFYPDDAWSLGMLVWIDRSYSDGDILLAYSQNRYLHIGHVGDTVYIDYIPQDGQHFAVSETLTGGYDYLWLQYSYGVFQVGFNGVVKTVSPISGQVLTAEEGVQIGGGGVFIDDLILVQSDQVDMESVRKWLLGL